MRKAGLFAPTKVYFQQFLLCLQRAEGILAEWHKQGMYLCVSLRNVFPHLVPQDEAEAVPQFLLGLALPFLPKSKLDSASWRKMCLKTKGFYTLLAKMKIQMKSEAWGRWEHLTLCLSQCQDAEDHKSHLSLKTSTFSCPH